MFNKILTNIKTAMHTKPTQAHGLANETLDTSFSVCSNTEKYQLKPIIKKTNFKDHKMQSADELHVAFEQELKKLHSTNMQLHKTKTIYAEETFEGIKKNFYEKIVIAELHSFIEKLDNMLKKIDNSAVAQSQNYPNMPNTSSTIDIMPTKASLIYTTLIKHLFCIANILLKQTGIQLIESFLQNAHKIPTDNKNKTAVALPMVTYQENEAPQYETDLLMAAKVLATITTLTYSLSCKNNVVGKFFKQQARALVQMFYYATQKNDFSEKIYNALYSHYKACADNTISSAKILKEELETLHSTTEEQTQVIAYASSTNDTDQSSNIIMAMQIGRPTFAITLLPIPTTIKKHTSRVASRNTTGIHNQGYLAEEETTSL